MGTSNFFGPSYFETALKLSEIVQSHLCMTSKHKSSQWLRISDALCTISLTDWMNAIFKTIISLGAKYIFIIFCSKNIYIDTYYVF